MGRGMQIFWLKRNLRLQDSEPFFQCMKSVRRFGPVLPLYLHEPSLIAQPDFARQHQMFIQETLDELELEFGALGGHMLQLVDDAVDAFQRIHEVSPITRIWTHRETTQNSQFERDKAVVAWCQANGVQLMEVEQNGLARGRQQERAFPDYFQESVSLDLKDPTGADLADRFAELPFPSDPQSKIPPARGEDKPYRQKGGRSAAVANMRRFFCVHKLRRYPYQLSSPNTAWDGCSRMSVYLAYGIVSDREVFQAVDRVVTEAYHQMDALQFEKFQRDARFFLDRMMWRRQYMQTFERRPELEFEPMLSQFDGVREAEFNEAYFEAWKEGRTGVPYIDAAMRCLRLTGYLNMRLRATVVSFATMNLWIPTRKVAAYLAEEFLDYEPAIHHVINQLIAGETHFEGLMVYDPVKQGLDHDRDGAFMRRWLPELKDIDADDLHDLSMLRQALDCKTGFSGSEIYPLPIVDCRASGRLAKRKVSDIRKGRVEGNASDVSGVSNQAQMSLI